MKMNEIKPIIGVCMDMCPPNEVKWREENLLLHEFELTKESQILLSKGKPTKDREIIFIPRADKRKVVKQFSRSSAGQAMQTPEELRPIKVLLKTVDYLLSKVAVIETVPWNICYDFIFDRLRAIRQDMSIQCSDDMQCITILEQCIRFHIYSSYYFGDEEVRLYDKHLNDIHLRECLQSVLKRYDTLSRLTALESPKFRPLFESIYIIYNWGTNDALLRYGRLPNKLKTHPMVKKCFRIGIQFNNRYYYPILQSIMGLKPPILALLASTQISKLHSIAIKTMSYGYNSQQIHFPLRLLTKWLCPFESNKDKANKYIIKLCQNYGLIVKDNDSVVFNKTNFNSTAKPLPNEKWSLLQFIVSQISVPSLLRGRHEYQFIEFE